MGIWLQKSMYKNAEYWRRYTTAQWHSSQHLYLTARSHIWLRGGCWVSLCGVRLFSPCLVYYAHPSCKIIIFPLAPLVYVVQRFSTNSTMLWPSQDLGVCHCWKEELLRFQMGNRLEQILPKWLLSVREINRGVWFLLLSCISKWGTHIRAFSSLVICLF